MIICPQCGAQNGQRVASPVKCTRCWYRFDKEATDGKRVGGAGSGNTEAGSAGDDAPEICGFVAYNGEDGENYKCGLPKHSVKLKHGNWIKV